MGFKMNRKKADKGRALDRDGYPIVVGARVYVGPRSTAMTEAPVGGFGGRVEAVTEHPKHGWVIAVREFDTWGQRDVRATAARVQAGPGTEAQRLDTEVFELVKKRAAKLRAKAVKEAAKT